MDCSLSCGCMHPLLTFSCDTGGRHRGLWLTCAESLMLAALRARLRRVISACSSCFSLAPMPDEKV